MTPKKVNLKSHSPMSTNGEMLLARTVRRRAARPIAAARRSYTSCGRIAIAACPMIPLWYDASNPDEGVVP